MADQQQSRGRLQRLYVREKCCVHITACVW